MRRLILGGFAVLIVACNGGHTNSTLAPSPQPMVIVLIGQPSLVNNPFVAASGVALEQFNFALSVNGKTIGTYPANHLPLNETVTKPADPANYEVLLTGPAGFDLAHECAGPDSAGVVRCSTQIVDLRPLCDQAVKDHIYEQLRLDFEGCGGAIIRVEEVSQSDEDDGDVESHGTGQGRFRKIVTNHPQNWITLEAICLGALARIKNGTAKPMCADFQQKYNGPARRVNFPPVGSLTAAIGYLARDLRHNNQYEVHGVVYAFPIPDDPYYPSNTDFNSNARR